MDIFKQANHPITITMQLRPIKKGFLFLCLFIPGLAFGQPADPLVDSLVRELSRSREDTNKVKLLMDLGNNIGYYDANKALAYASQGLELSKRINYPTGIARTHYLLGNTYLDLGDYTKARENLDEAEKIFESLQRTDMIGMIQNARGNWYYMQSDMWNASHYYMKATEIFHQLKDTIKEIFPYQNLIASLGETKNYEKAITLSKKLLVLLEKRGDSLQLAHALNHIVLNNIARGNMQEAGSYVPRLLSFIENTLDFNLASDSYNVIGEYYYKNNQYDTAIRYYKIALDKALRNNYQPAQYNLSIGAAYLKKNELPLAYTYLAKAVEQAREANSRDIYFRACLPLSEYYEKTNDIHYAYYYLQEYTKLNDSILVEETRQYSTHLEAVYENNKKENEILQLKTTELQKTLAIRKRNNYLYLAGGLFLVAVIFFLLKSRNDQIKRRLLEQDQKLKDEKILSLEKEQQVISLQAMVSGQETERNRVAKDLHDGLGGLFSTAKMMLSTLEHEQEGLKNNPLFAKSFELVNSAAEEVRRIAHNMMPEVLMKMGLVQSIREMCNSISAGKILQCAVQAYGMDKRLASSTEIMLFRIIQELMNNIIKHANATEAIIQLNREGNRLSITVEDNGRGFPATDPEDPATAGLASVQNRVTYLNGNFSIDSRQEVGTTVMMDFLIHES